MTVTSNMKNNVLPVLFGFSLTVASGVIGNYILTRDAVNANTIRINEMELNQTKREGDHVRLLIVEQRQGQESGVYTAMQHLLEKQGDTLNRIDKTLTTISVGTGAELTHIKQRLDKAGF